MRSWCTMSMLSRRHSCIVYISIVRLADLTRGTKDEFELDRKTESSNMKFFWLYERFLCPFYVNTNHTYPKISYLLHFFVLRLLLFLLLFLCVVVNQGLVPLWQEGKMDFPVALVTFPAAGSGGSAGGPLVLVLSVERALLVIHAVLVPLIFCSTYVCVSVGRRCRSCVPVKHWWERFGLHVACLALAAALADGFREGGGGAWGWVKR